MTVTADMELAASPGADEHVLSTLMTVNDPSNAQESLPSYRDIPPTPQLLINVKERYIRPDAQPEDEMDEDDIRTRRYWKRWGNRAAKELVKVIDKEKLQRSVKRRELVYSARVREPKYRKDSEESDGSSDTGISLLTTSSMAVDKVAFNDKAKKKNVKNKENEQRVDWEKFARKRTGMIDRMMRNDASALGAMVGGDFSSVDVNARERAADIMSAEERRMLTQCAYRRGLEGSSKSQSTENVITLWPKRPLTGKPTRPILQNAMPPALRPASRTNTSRPQSRSSVTFSPIKSELLPSRGCTPTPANIKQRLDKTKRSGSALIHHFPVANDRQNSSFSRSSKSHSIVSNSVPNSVKKYMEGVKGLPDFEGTFSRRVRQRIRRTVSALDRIVGDGDELDMIAEIPGEKGRYTVDDYANRPKYPQRVLITPQLASVIKTDIKYRMGRPRLHQIKRHDISYFDKQNPPVDRSHRNLLIFNWLLSISDDDFELSDEPEIVDLEGELAEYKNVLRHDDVMSRDHSSLSHVSGGLSDADGFSMSRFSGDDDDDIDDDHVSFGASGDDDDTKTEGDRMSPGMSYLSSSRPDSHT